MENLPNEILLKIISYNDLIDILALMATSRKIYYVAKYHITNIPIMLMAVLLEDNSLFELPDNLRCHLYIGTCCKNIVLSHLAKYNHIKKIFISEMKLTLSKPTSELDQTKLYVKSVVDNELTFVLGEPSDLPIYLRDNYNKIEMHFSNYCFDIFTSTAPVKIHRCGLDLNKKYFSIYDIHPSDNFELKIINTVNIFNIYKVIMR